MEKNYKERGKLFYYEGIDVLQDCSGFLFSQWLASYMVEDELLFSLSAKAQICSL